MRRYEIADAAWARLAPLRPTRRGPADDRRFVNAVLCVVRTGVPWRDLPEWFGLWRRCDRWAGVWGRAFDALQNPDAEWLLLGSTVVRAHPCAAGA